MVEDVDNNFAQERFSTREGAIFKPSTQSLFSYLGDDWAKYNQIYDPKTDLTATQKQRVIDFAKLVTNGSDAEFAAQLPSYIDLDEFARYLSINVWLVNMDSILAMGQNYYLYLNPATNRFVDYSLGSRPVVRRHGRRHGAQHRTSVAGTEPLPRPSLQGGRFQEALPGADDRVQSVDLQAGTYHAAGGRDRRGDPGRGERGVRGETRELRQERRR